MKKDLIKSITTRQFGEDLSNLHSIAYKAYRTGHYIESAIIDFQLVEIQLRIIIFLLAQRIGLSDSTYEMVEKEDRFFLLVIYLDLLKPDNGLSDRLRKLNKDRKDFVHGLLFICLPSATLNKKLKKFSEEAIDLIGDLGELVEEIHKKEIE
jgi:hypothetical protein